MRKFIDVDERWQASGLSRLKATESPGLLERTFQRDSKRDEDQGRIPIERRIPC